MGSFTDYLEDKLLNHTFRNTAYTQAATVYIALYTVTPSDSSSGTEVTTSGTAYARQSIAFNAPSPSGTIVNTSDILYAVATATYGTVVAFAILDASTSGNMLCWGAVSPNVTINTNDQLKFVASTGVTITLD